MTDHPLDIEDHGALLAYLRETGRISPEEIPEFTNLSGGVSNRTVHVRRPTGECWVLKQALRRLRVKVEWFSDPRRIEREAMGMRRLDDLAPPGAITRLIFLDPGPNLLAMEAVPQPHANWKDMLLADGPRPDHVRQFAQILGTVHRRASEMCDALEPEFGDRSFFESLRLEPYYLYTAAQVPEAAAFLTVLVARTRATRQTLVHGDYSPKNILVHNGRLVLLDHEVIHLGDGAFDLGFSLAHLLSKAHHLPAHRNAFATAATAYWETYREAIAGVPWSDELEPRAIAHTLGCLLARCRGRSPLEYLSPEARTRQAEAVVAIMHHPPGTLADLADEFLVRLRSPLPRTRGRGIG
jgi:5-methylthioribose kinase